jgi:hypothetical protein
MPRAAADVLHAVGLHAGNIDRDPSPAGLFFNQSIGFTFEGPALEFTIQNIHGLMVKMIVNRDLSTGFNRKQAQPVLGVTVTVIACFGKLSHACAQDIMRFAPVWELVD